MPLPRILVIDDDDVDRTIVRRALQSSGMKAELVEAVSCATGIVALQMGGFDCVVLDHDLPDGKGIDLLQRLAGYPDIRCAVVMLTGSSDEANGILALKAGAEDYLSKARLDPASLTKAIRYAIERHKMRMALEDQTKSFIKLAVELSEANTKLDALAVTDGLTGIPNRRKLEERLKGLFGEAQRGRDMTLVMADIDHFKNFNDDFGHQAGDAILVAVAKALALGVRASDLAARYGGEEFTLLLTDMNEESGAVMIERVRSAIAGLENPYRNVTMSFGISAYRPEFRTPEALLKAADKALYAAKLSGRNRIVRYSDLPEVAQSAAF